MVLRIENLIKNLIKLWSGEFKGLDAGQKQYIFPKSVREAVAPDITADGVYTSAEMLSFWTLYLGPVLLQGRVQDESYYIHFVELVRLLNICLQFEITMEELEDIRLGFIKWVDEIYYQFDPQHVALCPLTIHALLHIAPSIKASGPVWYYWAFPIERRRFPFAALTRQVLEEARLAQIKVMYDVLAELSLRGRRMSVQQDPTCILLPPQSPTRPEMSDLTSLIGALVTRFRIGIPQLDVSTAKNCLRQAEIRECGKVKRIDSEEGDTMRAVGVRKLREDSRDASFVRYEMFVDKNANNRHAREDFELQTFYGQLQRIYVIRFTEPQPQLKVDCPTTYIMCRIHSCRLQDSQIPGLDIHLFDGMGNKVGRVPCGGNKWAIIDRSGGLAQAEGDDDGEVD
ncbi:hypothetical protein L218DRAFT_975347 [Marasmius fiardii PR-910]|nr:hypothetical protein L218DRAFT_975347 [Marasmius fiardii PR-910]